MSAKNFTFPLAAIKTVSVDQLLAFDRMLFAKINLDWTNGFFDWLFPNITDLHKNPYFLAIALLIIIWTIYRKGRSAAKWAVIMILAVAMADTISYRVIKHLVDRPRPQFAGIAVQLRTSSHSGSSFPSNHTANVFAAASVIAVAYPPATLIGYAVAAAIGYSRIYVGVHYPSDVIAGALLGLLIGWALRRGFAFWFRVPDPPSLQSRIKERIDREQLQKKSQK